MYDEAWYSFVPDPQLKKDDAVSQKPRHRRRESLLKQPTDDAPSFRPAEPLLEAHETASSTQSPPRATLTRRAQSYSDFYHVVHSQLKKEKPVESSRMWEWSNADQERDAHVKFHAASARNETAVLNASYDKYHDQLSISERHLNEILEGTIEALSSLEKLSKGFNTVDAQTNAFQSQCDDLLDEQRKLKQLSRDVNQGLQYYSYLEPITRRLNAPGALRMAGDESWVEMLENLDMCIEYLALHPEHRDSEVYLSRYKSLLVRATSLVSVKFNDIFEESAGELSQGNANDSMTQTKLNHIYLKISKKLDDELGSYLEVIRNAVKASTEDRHSSALLGSPYGPVVFETIRQTFSSHTLAFVSSRRSYALPIVKKQFEKEGAAYQDKDESFLKFARACVAAALDATEEETKMYFTILGPTRSLRDAKGGDAPSLLLNGSLEFEDHIKSFAELLWTVVEPSAKTQDVGTLVDFSSYLSDRFQEYTGAEEDEETRDDGPPTLMKDYTGLMKAVLCKHFLQKLNPGVLERLREILLRQVTSYTPVLDDLISRKADPLQPTDAAILDRIVQVPGQALSAGYSDAYAPLKTAIRLLILFRDISSDNITANETAEIVKGVGYEIIHEATQAIMKAATMLKSQDQRFKVLDANVFILKNLYILKAFILTYEISPKKVSIGIDFYHIYAVFQELQGRGELFNWSSYYKLLSSGELLPRVVENIQDARMELDGEMRTSIRQLSDAAVDLLARGEKSSDFRSTIRQHITSVLYQSHEQQVVESLFEEIERVARERGVSLLD